MACVLSNFPAKLVDPAYLNSGLDPNIQEVGPKNHSVLNNVPVWIVTLHGVSVQPLSGVGITPTQVPDWIAFVYDATTGKYLASFTLH